MKKQFIVHPLLFAAYPALLLFSRNIYRIPAAYCLLVIAIIVTLASLLWILLAFILKNTAKAALITSLVMVWFFFFGPVFAALRGQAALGFFILRQRHFFPLWTLVFALAIFFTMTKRIHLNNLMKILDLVSTSLVAFCLINIAGYGLGSKTMPARHKTKSNIGMQKIDTGNQKSHINSVRGPDVYYIILDSYSSYDNLKKFYNFDNRDFYAYLTRKGFYIAQKSRSNYATTGPSLASSLNMEYINRDIADADRNLGLPKITLRGGNNKVMDIFKSMGYKCISVGAPNRYADLSIVHKYREKLAEYIFYKYVLAMTPVYKLSDIYTLSSNSYREEVLYYFEQLARISATESPKFVFAHIGSPHPPFFVFGPNAERFSLSKIFKSSPRKIYLYQTIFINKKVEELIDTILSQSKDPPIIILQSDHGFTIDSPSVYQLDERWLTERFPILNAYYLPGDAKRLLYDSITPVNTFRVILNYYFNANYELLKDENWLSPYGRPYDKFVNVTQKIKDID